MYQTGSPTVDDLDTPKIDDRRRHIAVMPMLMLINLFGIIDYGSTEAIRSRRADQTIRDEFLRLNSVSPSALLITSNCTSNPLLVGMPEPWVSPPIRRLEMSP